MVVYVPVPSVGIVAPAIDVVDANSRWCSHARPSNAGTHIFVPVQKYIFRCSLYSNKLSF